MARTTWHLPRRPKTIIAVAPAAFMLVVGISGKPKQWRLSVKGQVDANGLFPNPTPDGKMPGESKSSPREIQNYLGRISGPLLDRIDLHIEVPPVKFREIAGDRTGETSAQIRGRVVAARQRQHARFADKPKITCNARMGTRELKQFCELDEATKELLQNAMADLNLSARAYDRILKVSRTIADLAGSEKISSDHVSEAIQYRSLDRQLWA